MTGKSGSTSIGIISLMLLMTSLAACARSPIVTAAAGPTLPIPSPSATATGAASPAPTETILPPTAIPEITLQSTPFILDQPTLVSTPQTEGNPSSQKTPAAILFINSPGPESRISSPIVLDAYAYPGGNNLVVLRLYGEDGRIMAKQEFDLKQTNNGWVAFAAQIPFTIQSAGEAALLTLTTYDGYDRRITAFSVPLILMQVGDSTIESSGPAYQPFYFSTPATGETIRGGNLHVEGFAHPFNLSPVVIELIQADGSILASKIVPIQPASKGAYYTSFKADVPYSVQSTIQVRLSIRQLMDHSPYLDLALSSITIQLNP